LLKGVAGVINKANVKFSGFKQTFRHELYQGKWYVKDIQRHLEARVNSKSRNMQNSLWQTDLSLTVTDIRKGNGTAAGQQIYSSADSLSQKLNQADFWGNFNIIQSTRKDTTGTFEPQADTLPVKKTSQPDPVKPSNRINGFTRADTLQGKLTPLRSGYDVTFYDLDVAVDIDAKSISGSNSMQFRVLEPFSRMQVDLYANLQIHQILYRGKPLPYTRECNAVFIQFHEKLPLHSLQEITIRYAGKPKEPNWDIPMDGGFLWEKDAAGNPWVQVVCQGSGASLWWPNKDHLSDEPDSVRMTVTVPADLMCIANGRLRRSTPLPGKRTRYEWFVSYPINNYNLTLNIGKYAHLQDRYVTTDTLTLDYYVMPYNLEKGKVIFDRVKPMLVVLESQYGKYPFPRDGFKLMESLYPMEHQSAVSFGKLPAGEMTDSLQAPMGLVWHEVSHEWWGNSVSCRDLADMWIHEAFATYSESLPLQAAFGPGGESEYMISLPEKVIGKEPIIGVYDVNHIHYDIGDMYEKGALVLYTFKNVLHNDALWRDLLLSIQRQFQYQTISTDELVRYINAKTKTDYTYFFDQYLRYPAIPTLLLRYGTKGDVLTIAYRWLADVKDFRMPVRITQSKGKFGFIYPTTNWQTISLPDLEPDEVEVDEARFYINVEEE
jgi:aminopeptidase N